MELHEASITKKKMVADSVVEETTVTLKASNTEEVMKGIERLIEMSEKIHINKV